MIYYHTYTYNITYNIVIMDTKTNQSNLYIILLLLALIATVQNKFNSKSITSRHSNLNYRTDYTFQFTTAYPYPTANVRIGFPISYSLSAFQPQLECYVSNSKQPNSFRVAKCWVEPSISLQSYFLVGEVVVMASNITQTSPYFVLLHNTINPANQGITPYFSVCIELGTTTTECDYSFGKLPVNLPPVYSTNLATLTTSPLVSVVGQGASYLVDTTISNLGSWYSSQEVMSVRLVLSEQFATWQPLCSIGNNLTAFDMTYLPIETTTFAGRSNVIECSGIVDIKKYLSNLNKFSFRIQTIINALRVGTWSDSYLQIVRSIHNEVVEIIPFSTPINVVAEQFAGKLVQSNYFRNATNMYYFYINHDVNLSTNSSIQITIGNLSFWKIHNVILMAGFTSPNTSIITVNSTSNYSTITLKNYGNATRKVQQIVAVNLTSPPIVGNQFVSINAFINSNQVGTWMSYAHINQTYGECSLLSLSAVRKKTKLPSNATGSLQLTFFLNYELPPSQGFQNGSIKMSVFPQLSPPNPDVNGVIKCYFKGMFQASNCTMDNSNSSKTVFKILSPPLQAYQYSQIPIIITTQGAINEDNVGFPINPLVTRYRFQTEFYLYNSSVIPSEVFYTQWIADAVEMNNSNIKIISLTHESNQQTNVQVTFNMPILTPLDLTSELRLMVQFMADPITKINAWQPNLGYQSDHIYKEYPCIVNGLSGTRIRCDLYTYRTTPGAYNQLHVNSDLTGSFFIIYGFINTITTGTLVTIELPKIKIGSFVNVPAWIKLAILSETPAQLQPFVELYFKNITAFTTLPPISMVPTAVNTSQTVLIGIQQNIQLNITWNPTSPSLVRFIKYQISQTDYPTFQTASSACVTTNCFSAGLPANWIVQFPTSSTLPFSMQTKMPIITAPAYIRNLGQTIPIYINTYDGFGKTLQKVMMFFKYIPQVLVGYYSFAEMVVYGGLQQWYSVSFLNSFAQVSSYPYIRVQVDPSMKFSSPVQCNTTTIVPYNQTGVIFTAQNSNSIVIWNIKQLVPSATYQIFCKMRTAANKVTTQMSPTLNIEVHHNYTVKDSFVAVNDSVLLKQAPISPVLGNPVKFTIDNPQVTAQQLRVNYVGPLFIDFYNEFDSSQYQSLTNLSANIKIVFGNHRYNKAGWTTPTTSNNDPPVCKVNNKRYACSWTNNPLTITINNPSLNKGNVKIELTSEYVAPQNGIKCPGSAGKYVTTLSLVDSTSIIVANHSFFIKILPHDLIHFEASSIVKDVGTESIYIVNFTLPTWTVMPNPYNHVSNYSRIFIEFPTQVGSAVLFKQNLGGYLGNLNEKVGCSFVTGTQYILPTPTNVLQCRFIPVEVTGGNVKIEIINHNGFTTIRNSLAVYLFKIFNPIIAYRSFDLVVSIQQVQVGTGNIYPLYSGKYSVFLDPFTNNSAPSSYLSIDNDLTVPFFDPLLDFGDYGAITLTAQTVSGNALSNPYYVIYKLPSFLNPQNNQLASAFKVCPASGFELCLTAPDIQYVAVKGLINPQTFQVFIKNYPISASQADTVFEALVIQDGRFTGKIIYNITGAYRWRALEGTMILNYVKTYGLSEKLDLNRTKCEIEVNFTIANFIPTTGSIQIVFPPSVTKIYPDCRSATGLGSGLFAAAGSPSGEIGCLIQNTNHWVITSFVPVTAGTNISIRGFIDLPDQSGTIGVGQIISYSDNHPTNIHANGSRIDYIKRDFGLVVKNTSAMNINTDIFMTQRSVIRQGYVGEFRLVFTPKYDFDATDYLQISMYKKDIKGNTGGFTLTARPKVCEFIQLEGDVRIGCIVLSQSETFIFMQQAIVYQIMPVETLLNSQKYELRLTSQDYIYPEGINYPTIPSTYKMDILINHTDTATIQLQQRYIQIYGKSFTYLTLTQFSYDANTYNPFWVVLNPAVTIDKKHQIVIEFPTMSNDGATVMFSNDLGYTGYKDGDWIPTDIFDCAFNNSFMSCRLYFGDYLRSLPARIVCGNFTSGINPGQVLKFAFAITNPPQMTSLIQSQIALPVFIYSYDPYLFQKINYNTINVGAYVNNAKVNSTPFGYFSTTTNQKDMPNQNLFFANNNANTLQLKDAYVLKFAFPIRVNGKFVSACQNFAGTVVYGDAYYHQNLRTVICLLINNPLPANGFPTTATFRLKNFYTPWYALTLPQLKVEAIATYFSSFTSSYIRYFDFFPTLQPRYLNFTTTSLLSFTTVLPHNISCQRNDYIIKIQLQTSIITVNNNLKNTKMIMLQVPQSPSADYDIWNSDCIEHFSSTVKIIKCQVIKNLSAIVITIQPDVYLNNRLIAIQTKGLAIRNPCALYLGATNAQWTAYFLSFQNNTAMTPSISNAYLAINSLNMQTHSMGFISETAANVSTYYQTFDWFEVPHQRYFNEFRQFDVNQYSPFSFQIFLFSENVAVPASGNFNILTLNYGSQYLPCGTQSWVQDLSICTPICYLMNNRIHNCVVDQTTNTTYMKFNFALPKNKSIHVYFSTEDPRNTAINGYHYIGNDDISKINITLSSAGSTYYFQTPYFQPSETQYGAVKTYPVRGISNASIDYATTQANMRNVFDMYFHMSRPDLAALKFQIPMVNPNNQPIFGPSYATSFFNLNNGDEYPCGCNQGGVTTYPPKCYLYYGDFDFLGSPTQIIMTAISQSASYLVKARILFNNPSIVGRWISVNVKAYAGTMNQSSLYGLSMIGYWNFDSVFQVSYQYTSFSSFPWTVYSYIWPNKAAVWRNLTSWSLNYKIRFNASIALNDYVIFELPIYTQDLSNTYSDNDEQSCTINFQLGVAGSNLPDDLMFVKQKKVTQYTTAFFVKKWEALNTNLLINYFKCKEYSKNLQIQYSVGKSSLYAYTYPINSYKSSGVYKPSSYTYYTDYVKYISPSRTRTLIEIDLTRTINNIIGDNFIWDNNTDYILEIRIEDSKLFQLFNVTGCRVVQGIINGYDSPVCKPISSSVFQIGKFTQIIINKRLNNYRVKIQVFHESFNTTKNYGSEAWEGSSYFSWIAYVKMWASKLAKKQNWYVFYSRLYSLTSYFSVYQSSGYPYCINYQNPTPINLPVRYFYNYLTNKNNLNVNLINVGTNAAMNSFQLRLTVNSKSIISMSPTSSYTGSYLSFRFKIVNYEFSCGTFTKFRVTYTQPGINYTNTRNHTLYPQTITCFNDNQIKIDYYFWPNSTTSTTFGNIWAGGVEGDSIDPGQSFEFDIQLIVTAEEPVIYRDWVSIQTYVDKYEYYYKTCNFSQGQQYYYPTQKKNTVAFSQDFWTGTPLFNTVTIQPISTNINQPTEMIVTLNNSAIGLGQTQGKKLLLQLNNNNNPFASYINDTTVATQVECICTSDWNPTSTGLLPTCIYRPSTATNANGNMMNSAIIVDLEIVRFLNARCYFPEWTLYAGPLYITAKAINDHGGITTDSFNYTINGAYLFSVSNTLTIASTVPSLLSATLTQTSSPSLYSPSTYVNTFLNTYGLVASFSEASNQPIIYIDFQKAGIIPDSRFCNKTFFIQCRVYNRFRHVLVAQYLASWSSNSALSIDSNYDYDFFVNLPKHQESGTNLNYNLIYRVIANPGTFVYSHIATQNRVKSDLLPTNVTVYVIPEPTSGTYLANKRTNLLISFTIRDLSNPMQVASQSIYSYYANKYAQIQITCNDTNVLANSVAKTRGCMALSQLNVGFQFDCFIDSTNKIIIRNLYIYKTYNSAGLIQLIVGITNPATPVVFTLTGYEYQIQSATNFAVSFTGTATYRPQVLSGVTVMSSGQLNMYPFFTKIYTDSNNAPRRVAFKLASSSPLPSSLTHPYNFMLMIEQIDLALFSTFECIIRGWSLEPTTAPQSSFTNSYRSYKQRTQHTRSYVNCGFNGVNKTALSIDIPHDLGLDATAKFYELVILPTSTGTAAPGFPNKNLPLFKLLTLPNSCEFIGKFDKYTANMFDLNSIFLITNRPLYSNGLLIDFNVNFNQPQIYPQHYLQVIFKDLDLTAVQIQYQSPGSIVPCTLSPFFINSSSRIELPHCIITNVDIYTNTILMRVTDFGGIVTGQYTLTLDNFMLPQMIAPLQNSSPFRICLKYSNVLISTIYQRCFGELFVIDKFTTFSPPSSSISAMTISNNTFGVFNVVGSLPVISYPMTASGAISDKMVMQLTSGYASTTSAPLTLVGFTPLWFNPNIDYYVYKQKPTASGSPLTLQLINLTNPEVYQKNSYGSGNVFFSFYDDLQPKSNISFSSPAYNTFTLQQANVYVSNVLYYDDVKLSIPGDSWLIYQTSVIILDNSTLLSTKQVDKVVLSFSSNVTMIDRCWVVSQTLNTSYHLDGACQTISSRSIAIYRLSRANNNNNLTLFLRMKIIGTSVDYNTTVYCYNGEVQYFSSGTQIFWDIDSTKHKYNFLDYTQNLYTSYYYEQAITQLSIGTTTKYLYLSLTLPDDLTYGLTVFTIYLNALLFPNNRAVQTKMICQWLVTDRYARKYNTGSFSICTYGSLFIQVLAPYGGLSRFDVNGKPITYLLKIRQFDPVATSFTMPVITTDNEFRVSHAQGIVLRDDSFTIYPFNRFQNGTLNVTVNTLSVSELATYTIKFTPIASVPITNEAVLQLQFDMRYFPTGLAISDVFKNYGVDTNNQTFIQSNGMNIAYKILPNIWVNGIPYSGHTLTKAQPEQTSVHSTSASLRVTLLLETNYSAGVPYQWKIPLLMNPQVAKLTYRLNLTLYNYMSATARPQKVYFNQIINPFYTQLIPSNNLNYSMTSVAQSNTVQQTTATLSINYGFPFVPDTTSQVEFKISSRNYGIIKFTDFVTGPIPDTSYNYSFFQRINVLQANKKINDGSTTINLGALQTANNFVDYFGFDWLKVHSLNNLTTTWKGGQQLNPLLACTVGTNVTANVVEGLSTSAGSEFLLKVVFTTPCKITVDSTLRVQFDGTQLTWSKDYECYTSFRSQGCFYSNGSLSININQLVNAASTVTISVFLLTLPTASFFNTTISGLIYALVSNPTTVIDNISSLAILPSTLPSMAYSGYNQMYTVRPLYENTRMKLRGRISARYTPMTYIQILHPFGWTISSHHRFYYSLNSTSLSDQSASLQWINTIQAVKATNLQNFGFYPGGVYNYVPVTTKSYSFIMQSTYDPSFNNNMSIGAAGSYYQLTYVTDSQIQNEQIYPQTVPVPLVILNPTFQKSQNTAIGLQFVINKQINIGDIIHIALDSHNLIENMYGFNSVQVECQQGIKGILSANLILVCDVQQYPASSLPLIVRVYPTNVVLAGTKVEIWVSPVINPGNTIVAGAIVTITRNCGGQQRCPLYQARGYFKVVSNIAITNYANTTATFTPSKNTEVQMQNVQHAYTFTSRTYSASIIDYPENYNNVMTASCTIPTGKCIVFPKQRRVVITINVPIASGSLILSTMVNGMYVNPMSAFIKLTIYTSSTLDFYNVYHKNLTTILKNYVTGVMNYMTITPTQSPNVFLRNYMNTAVIKLYGLYTDPYINAFYINAPKDIVEWDKKYCNATLGSNTNNPYPTRLNCQYQNDSTIAITIPQGVNYQSGVTDYFLITVNCKFKIIDFTAAQKILYISTPVTSGFFNSYGSFSNSTSDYHYYITQASTTISISQLQIPPIGDIEFVTEAYKQRLANINDTAYFDMLFDPTTPQTISTIELQVPDGFGYPPVGNHDACSLIFWTKQPITSCEQIRRNGKTIIRIKPPASYTNGPALIHIKNTNYTNWFTAPSIPGNWYNYTISLYSANGTLLQRDYNGNITAIGGLDLDLAAITLQNGRDAEMEEIIDLTFPIGKLPLYKGYADGLQNGEFYSEINIGFENWKAFGNLINQNNVNGSLVGCVTQGLPHTREIKCLLEGGSTIEDQPIIRIEGYDWVPPYSTITISLANVLQLNTTTRNTLSLSVLLKQVGSWKQGELYNPQQIVFKQTSPLSAPTFSVVSLSYLSSVKVGSPTTFQISITPSVDITNFIIVKLPQYFINRQFELFNYSCNTSARTQVFYRSDIVRIYPSGGVHPKKINIVYTINGFPSSQYAFSFNNIPVIVEGYSGYKQVQRTTVNMSFQSLPCDIGLSLITISSPYSYDQSVAYKFQIDLASTNVSFLENTTFAFTFPTEYSSLLNEGVGCSVELPLNCQIVTQNRIEVSNIAKYMKKSLFINITGITNPVDGNKTFILQTYQGKNTDQVQCKGQTSFLLRKSTLRNCSLAVNVSHFSLAQQADYSFTLLCNQAIRNQTDIKIALPNDYASTNMPGMYSCWSNTNPLNLQTSTCPLVYTNATYYLIFPSINVEYNQISITISARINNPALPRTESISALLSIQNETYGKSNSVNITMSNSITTIMSGMSLSAIPDAAGASSIYVLQIPSKYVKSKMQIELPTGFNVDSDVSVALYYSNNSQWLKNLSYFELLQKSYNNNTLVSVSKNAKLRSILIITNITLQSTYWAFLLIKYIQNPSYFDNSQKFKLSSIDASGNLLYVSYVNLGSLGLEAGSIHFVNLQVMDNDLGKLTSHNVTYRVDEVIYTNLTSIIIIPPKNNPLYALAKLDCCLYINSVLIECHSCQVGRHQLQFLINKNGLTLFPDDRFTIQITSLFTSFLVNDCQELQDYYASYFKAMIFRNATHLTHQTLDPSADDFTPCVPLVPRRGNIDITVPNVLYAGMSYRLQIGLTRPSKMVRVRLNSTSPFLSFSPSMSYINNYDIQSQYSFILVGPTAIPSSAYINISHEQSIVYSLFRENLPQLVQIRNDRTEYVEIDTMQACSIGLWIEVTIKITWPASTDIYVNISPDIADVIELQYPVVLIPATSNQSFFRFRYNGTRVPNTLPVSLSLQAATILHHQLRKIKIYFYFSVTQQFQTLPPVLKIKVLDYYLNNTQYAGKQIYNKYSSGILYDQLSPSIIGHFDGNINSTWASVQIFTRHQGWVYYVLKERGNLIDNLSVQTIKAHPDVKRIKTFRNSTQYVNAYCWINFTRLTHQTIYDIYAFASDSLGDSNNYIVHRFMTTPLSNAIQLRIDTNKLITDSVYIVHALSDVLNIDILRVKVVDSYIVKNDTFSKANTYQNQLLYRNKIVVSPSWINDRTNPLTLVTRDLLESSTARQKLKYTMPQFVDNFESRINTTRYEDRVLVELIITRPKIKNMPSIISISYYSMILMFNLRKKGILYAVAVESGEKPTTTLQEVIHTKQINGSFIGTLTDDIPYSKQIINGVDSYNKNLSITVRNYTDKNGDGWLNLGRLKPGKLYTLYLTFITQYYYEPILYAHTSEITTLQFFTLQNPNIKHNSKVLIMDELRHIDPEMYAIIKKRQVQANQTGSLSK